MEKKLQKPYPTGFYLLTVQDLWQAHYQILLIILLKKFIKLNVKMDMIKKNAKRVGSNAKNASFILNVEINWWYQ